MTLEIERKWIVDPKKFLDARCSIIAMDEITQGYIALDAGTSVRVRIKNGKAILGIKKKISNLSREEFEYEIPVDDGNKLLEGFPTLSKTRSELLGSMIVDKFHGHLDGLWLCEKEFSSEDEANSYISPAWCIDDVTEFVEYSNAQLVKMMYFNGEIVPIQENSNEAT